ncbi:MAG: pitrilysin family protein, partial [Pseudomonadota bacterium]
MGPGLSPLKPLTAVVAGLLPILAIAIGLVAAPAPSHASVFNPESFTLDNGMQVVVITNRRVPVVTHMVWYKVGAADEAPGQSGIAHFLEHLMFRGTETIADGEFSEMIRRNGGNDNAFTSWDYTAYFQNIAVDRLETVMEMEADRMVNLRLDPDVVEIERGVVLQERSERVDARPGGRLGEQMRAALYRNHPYGTPIIGWRHEIETLTAEQIKGFYRRWYSPSNAVLVVSGDIDAATLRPLADRIYGALPAGEDIERRRPIEPDSGAERRLILRDDTVRQASWRRTFPAPSYRTATDNTAYAAQVLSEILGGSDISRLYRSLVIDQGLVISAGSGYSPLAYDGATFSLFVSPPPNPDWDVIESAVMAEINRLIDEGIPQDELEDAKKRMATRAIYARDSLGGPART